MRLVLELDTLKSQQFAMVINKNTIIILAGKLASRIKIESNEA